MIENVQSKGFARGLFGYQKDIFELIYLRSSAPESLVIKLIMCSKVSLSLFSSFLFYFSHCSPLFIIISIIVINSLVVHSRLDSRLIVHCSATSHITYHASHIIILSKTIIRNNNNGQTSRRSRPLSQTTWCCNW